MLHAQMRANSSWPSPALTRPPLQTLHSAVYTTLRYPHEATEHQRLSLPRSHKNPQMRRCAAKASRSRCRFRADGAPRAYRDPLVTADVNVWVAQVGFDERREQRAHADYGNMPRFTAPSALVVLLGSAKFLCPTRGVGAIGDCPCQQRFLPYRFGQRDGKSRGVLLCMGPWGGMCRTNTSYQSVEM